MKKILSIFLVVAMLLTTFSVYAKAYIPGDLSGDGLVDTRDIIMLRRDLAGGYDQIINPLAGDVNADGLRDTRDIILIRRYLAGGYDVELLPGKVDDSPIKVTFYEGYGPYAYAFNEIELLRDANGEVNIKDSDIPKESFPWLGYKKSDYMPKTYEDYDGKYEVEPDFYYIDNGKFKPFDDSVIITEDTDVYWMYNEFSVNAFGSAIVVRYDKNSRMIDSTKTFLDKAIAQLKTAKKTDLPIYKELNGMVLGALESSELFNEDKYIKTIKLELDFIDALKETDTQSINNVTNDNRDFEVIRENLKTIKDIHSELLTITFDAILDVESNSEIKAMVSLVGYDVCEAIFENVRNDYCNKLKILISDVENKKITAGFIPSEIKLPFNPIEDIFTPLFDEAEEKVIGELDESIRYNENPYLQYLIEEQDMFRELFNKDNTGYKMNDIIAYAEFMVKFLIAADDAICWYDGIEGIDINAIYDTIFAEMYTVNSRIDEVLSDVNIAENIPDAVKKTLECMKDINSIFLGVKRFLKNDTNIQAELQALIESGELQSRIDEFKESVAGQNFDAKFIDDFVKMLENIAENGGSDYKVPVTDITTIDKYEVEIGDYTFTMSRYFIF